MEQLATNQLGELAQKANDAHLQANQQMSLALQYALSAGAALNKAKSLLEHGEWLLWLERNIQFSQPTAHRYRELDINRDLLSNYSDLNNLAIDAALKLIASPDGLYTSETGEWETPQWFFDKVMEEFPIGLDVCATPENAKARRFFTKESDGLAQDWHGVCWMNPPYGREIGAWMEKALSASQNGATVVCLIPARTDASWFWDFAMRGEIRFLRGRLKFGGGNAGAPFPSALVILGKGVKRKMIPWEVSD